MRLLVCAVRDRAADAFMRPFVVPATGLAIRSFSDEINRKAPDNPMSAHPDDYDLFKIGEFEEETGKLFGLDAPQQLAIGKQVVVPAGS